MSRLRRTKHKKILEVMKELEDGDGGGGYYGYNAIAKAAGLDRKEARRIVRHLARRNHLKAREEYAITEAGKKRLENDQQPE